MLYFNMRGFVLGLVFWNEKKINFPGLGKIVHELHLSQFTSLKLSFQLEQGILLFVREFLLFIREFYCLSGNFICL